MRASIITALALASAAVQATQITGLPSCTSECISSDYGGCGTLDVKCICESTTFIAGLACCISAACDEADQEATIKFADSLCEGYGVTDLPSSATCAAGQTPSFVSGASSTTAAAASATTGESSTTTSAATAASSTSAASGSSTSGSSASAAASSTSSSASSSASAAATGAANRLEAAALGAGALVFGALAAL